MSDVSEALRILHHQGEAVCNREIRRVLLKVWEELSTALRAEDTKENSGKEILSSVIPFNTLESVARTDLDRLKQLASSIDNLSENDLPMTSSILSESGYSSNI